MQLANRSQNNRFAAMTGERMKVDGFEEISAVCTHPDFTGRGCAAQLVKYVSQHFTARHDAVPACERDESTGEKFV